MPRVAFVVATVLSSFASTALADARQELIGEGFELGRMSLAPAGDRFLLVPDAGHGRDPLRVMAAYEVGDGLLTLVGPGATSSSHFERLHIATSWSICPYFLALAELPLVIHEDVTVSAPQSQLPLMRLNRTSKFAPGDAVIGWRATLPWVDEPSLRLGVLGQLWIPSGNQGDLTGDGSAGGTVEAVGQSTLGIVEMGLTAGYAYRPSQELSGARIGAGPALGAAVGLDFWIGSVVVRPDVELRATFVSAGPNDVSFSRRSPIESAIGVVMDLGVLRSSIHFTQGLTEAPGLPGYRLFAGLTYTTGPRER